MAATVVFAVLIFCLFGSEPDLQISESVTARPAVQETFIEVHLDSTPIIVESVVVENGEIQADAVPATVEETVIDLSAETREPFGMDVDALDQIEPTFVEDVEMATDAESAAVETTPLDRETEAAQPVEQDAKALDAVESAIETKSIVPGEPGGPILFESLPTPGFEFLMQPQAAGETVVTPNAETTEPIGQTAEPAEVALPVSVEDAPLEDTPVEHTQIADGDSTIADPQPEAVQQNVGNHDMQAAEPVSETTPIVEPAFVAEPETVTHADQEAVAETVVSPSVESTEPVEHDAKPLDAVEPIVVENAGIIPDPQPEVVAGEVVEGVVCEPATTTAAPVAEPARIVEPDFGTEAESVTGAGPVAVAETVGSPIPEAIELVAEPIQRYDSN